MSDILKGGWHPKGDLSISRATWKKDLKNFGVKRDEDAGRARDHVSTPLTSLKDPDSFGPPPKHTAYHPNAQAPKPTTGRPSNAATGLGSPVPSVPARANTQAQEQVEAPPAGPYRVNTTGLRTDNLPKPPGRNGTPVSASPATTTRPVPSLPPRQSTGPPPVLPPRQSEDPNEYTPAPPPSYGEATRTPQASAPPNTAALNRLGQAGVSVPGFGIGAGRATAAQQSPTQGNSSQMNELQQRFARMNGGAGSSEQPVATPSWNQVQAVHSAVSASPAASAGVQSAIGGRSADMASGTVPSWKQAQALHSAAASNPALTAGLQSAVTQKKKPPPPPKKLGTSSETHTATDSSGGPPPIPMLSKPRPG